MHNFLYLVAIVVGSIFQLEKSELTPGSRNTMWPNYLLGPSGLDCSSLGLRNESTESYLIQENQLRDDYSIKLR